jgi:tRNA-dihydrouridine synthase
MLAASSEAASTGTTPPPLITVKHRLNVVDDTVSSPYDVEADNANGYEADFGYARNFIETVASAGVTRFQVHARKALLSDENASGQVWVPSDTGSSSSDDCSPTNKVDHKRAAMIAKKHARSRTLFNRSVPPLRPGIVRDLSTEFPELELVSNGGVSSMSGVTERLNQGVHGVMVGRAAINHPALFAGVDQALYGRSTSDQGALPGRCRTRGEVLDRYIAYVEEEEERLSLGGLRPEAREATLRKLTSPPYSLFVGEAGCDKYQRRIRNMSQRFMTRPYTASGVLRAARVEVQLAGSFDSGLDSAVPLDKVVRYEDAIQRAGPMQKMIA